MKKSLVKDKRGVMEGLSKLGIAVAALAISLVVAFLVMAQAKTQIVSLESIDETNASTYTIAYNSTSTLQTAVSIVPDWVPIVIITVIGGLLISLVTLFRRKG